MIPLVIKSFGDHDDRWAEPAVDGRGQLDLDPGEVVVGSMTAKAMTVTVGSGPNERQVFSLDDQPIEVKVTSARVVFRCAKYDTGGGWVGFGVAGFATAAIANSVSKRNAAKRSADTVLAGHLRFPWIAAAGGSAKQGWLDTDALLLRGSTPNSAGNELVTLQFDLPTGSDTGAIAADIIRRAAAYRLEHETLDADETAALTELLTARPLGGSGRSVPMHAPPTYFRIGTGESVFWPVAAAASAAPAVEAPTEVVEAFSLDQALAAEPRPAELDPAVTRPPAAMTPAALAAARSAAVIGSGVRVSTDPPIDWPHYGIGFGAAIKRGFTKYATFSGRASRSEYWWWALFAFLVYLAVALIFRQFDDGEMTSPFLWAVIIFWLVFAIPTLAVAIRRLHDTGRSGWTWLIGLIPFVGGWIVIAYLAGGTSLSAERYGPPGGSWGAAPPARETPHRSGPNRGPLVAFVAVIAVLAVIGAGFVVRNWVSYSARSTSGEYEGGYDGGYEVGDPANTGDLGVDSSDPTSDPTETYEPPAATEPSDEPSDTYSPEPVAPPTTASGRVPMGDTVQLDHFTVTMTDVFASAGGGVAIRASVCLTVAVPDEETGKTRISWDPWRLIVNDKSIRPSLADDAYPIPDMYPKEGFYDVGDCVTGNIPFSTVSAHAPIEAVRYRNGLKEKAVWTLTEPGGLAPGDGTPQGEIQADCGPSQDQIRRLRNHPEILVKQATCSTVDPDWAMVKVDYRRQDDPPVWAAADMYFSKINGVWVQAHDDMGAHAYGWCQAYKKPGFPSDFKSKLQDTCG